jgi:hypothetical protein
MSHHQRLLGWFFVLLALAPGGAAEWQQDLYLDGGGWWRSRVGVTVSNDRGLAVAGEPVALGIGSNPGQAALVGKLAQSLRVCDARGIEMLFAIVGPDGTLVTEGPIPAGSSLVIPAECPPHATAAYDVYCDNPAALAVPDFLRAHTKLVNGDLETGEGEVPAHWQHDQPDPQHRASWSRERPQSGQHCLKTEVAAGAPATWISTRQRDLRIVGGAKYRMQAWVRAEGVRGQAGWYIHVGHRERPMLISPMLSGGEGSFDWRQVTAEFTAPAEADLADLGTVLYGTGTAWFDNVTLECLTPGQLRATASALQSLPLHEAGAEAPWPAVPASGAKTWSHRLAVDVFRWGAEPAEPLWIAVDLVAVAARLRGRLNREAIMVTFQGRRVPHRILGSQLLFASRGPERSLQHYFIYLADELPALPQPAADMALVNLAQNPSFERGNEMPESWTAAGAVPGSTEITFGCDSPGRDSLGNRCARLHVAATAPKGWRGWRQDVPVKPGRTYLLSAWVKCQDIRGGEVRVHAHRRTADGKLSEQEPMASIGPGLTGTTDWTLVSGRLTMPSDTTVLQLHLTMDQSGTLWHDEITCVEIVPGRVGRLAGRPRAATPSLAVWPVPAIVKVFPDDVAPLTPVRCEISAARNEREPLQMAVRSGRAIPGVRVEVNSPRGPNGFRLDDCKVNVVGFVPVDYPTNYYESQRPAWQRKVPNAPPSCDGWPGLWPDPLLPQTAFDLRSEATQPIWLTVAVPHDAPAGSYTGQVRFVAAGQSLAEIPFGVRVWNFTLPEERHFAAIYDVRFGPDAGRWGRTLAELYPEIIRFMAARRLCPDSIQPGPKFRREQGRLTADFDAFDKAATVYFDELKFPFSYTPWDFYLFGWGHPPKPIFGEQPYPGSPPFEGVDRRRLRPEYKLAYQEMLRLFWDHLKEKGWERRTILYISDEPFAHQEHIRTQMKALCEMIHEVDQQIPIYSSTWKHVPDWDGFLNVWGLGHDGRVSTGKLAELRAGGARVWFTTDGQMCTDTPYCAVERLLPHYAFRYGAEAYEFWGVAWHTYDPFRWGWHSFIHQTSEPGRSSWVRYPNGDGFLLYPGAAIGQPVIVSSMRCEQAREGVEDYEYLYLLRERCVRAKAVGKDVAIAERALASAAALVTIPNAGGRFSTRILPQPDAVERIRQELAAALESLSD